MDFYRAAKRGLNTSVHWVDGTEMPLKQAILEKALPITREGLARAGLKNCDQWLDIIEARVDAGATGAQWILDHWHQHGDAAKLVCDYLDQAQSNKPVHTWRAAAT